MADKIVVLNRGRIEQVGSPMELYRNPANLFVAGFIGSPKMNLIGGAYAVSKQAATVGIRPEHISWSREKGPWSGTIVIAEHLGSDTFLHVEVDDVGLVTVRAEGAFEGSHGDRLFLIPDETKLYRFDKEGIALSPRV